MPRLDRFTPVLKVTFILCTAAALSACITLHIPPRVDKTISLQPYHAETDATADPATKVRVNEVTVTVAQAGKSLFIYKVRNQIAGGPVTSHYGHYWLDGMTEVPVKKTLSRLVELDPKADHALKVEVLVNVRYRLGKDFIGRVFKTTSLVALKAAIAENDNILEERVYAEVVQDSFHPSFDIWPTEEEIGGPLQQAFEKAVDKLREDLPSLKATL